MKNYLSTIKDNIVYHNDMNKFVFKNFNEADFKPKRENNFFGSVISKSNRKEKKLKLNKILTSILCIIILLCILISKCY
ncbi:Uncharacterised protein [Helicobacter pullorum]|nr:Uncharacterised protein [Helicobacter pullorum]